MKGNDKREGEIRKKYNPPSLKNTHNDMQAIIATKKKTVFKYGNPSFSVLYFRGNPGPLRTVLPDK